jgi:membrane dipeptidase
MKKIIDDIVCDGHCDTVLEIFKKNRRLNTRSKTGQLDIPRLQIGGVDVQVFAVYIEKEFKPKHSLQRALQLIDSLLLELSVNKDAIELAASYEKIKSIIATGKIAAILAIEGGEALEGELSNLRIFYLLGVRLITLTWNQRNDIADGSDYAHSKRGLSLFGKRVIQEMNRLGMMIDVSHISESGFWDVLQHSRYPVLASHSNCYQLCPHQRNLKDSQIQAIAEKGGLVCVTYVPDFLRTENRKAVIDDVINHIDHIASLVGTDFIGLGSDFDGCQELPEGLEGADKVFRIKEKLIERGYQREDIQKIMGKNFLNFFRRVTEINNK